MSSTSDNEDDDARNSLSSDESQSDVIDLEKYQNVNRYIKHLPYFEKIVQNGYEEFEEIKFNLTKAIAFNELRPGLCHWSNRLQTFINEYGLFFDKSDHLKLIKIYLNIIATPDIDLIIVDLCFSILVELLKKYEYLTREDLVIDWKPIYNLYLRIHKIDERSSVLAPDNIEHISFLNFISFARIYFDINSTREMLEEWRPLMCPFDMSTSSAFERFNLFMPTLFMAHEVDQTINLWLDEFLNFWFSFSSKVYWESNIINLFARVAKESVGLFDWSPYIPFIFSKTLRGLGLNIASEYSLNIDDNTPKEASILVNTLSQSFAYSEVDIDSIAVWIIYMIGCGSDRNLCMNHIKKIFKILRSYYYPSNIGSLENFFALLQGLPEYMIERVRREKTKKLEWLRKGRSTECFLKEDEIVEFVFCLKDIVLTAIFSKTNFNDAIKTYQYLCFLRSDIMLPPLIEKIYSSFQTLIEPHRYTSMLACLVSVPREIVRYNPNYVFQAQSQVITLLISVLPGIDINDLNKFILTFQFLTNILNSVVVCDCSPAVMIRSDLTEAEKELCIQTKYFEDFIHELFSKLFTFIENMANDTSYDSSASSAAAAAYARTSNTLTDENVTQVHVVQMLQVLVNQSAKPVLKLILNKLFNFINGKTFDIRSGDIISNFCGYLVTSNNAREAFERLFFYAYSNLMEFKHTKNYDNFLRSEKGDRFISWNLHLFSQLLKAHGNILMEYISNIRDVMNSYKICINKECLMHLTSCYNTLIASLTKIYPKENCSVGYSLAYDDEKKFFTKHIPIRDWGKVISIDELEVEYHIPTVEELSTALDIVGKTLNDSMNFLRKSILQKKDDKTMTKIGKEEIYRELNIIHHTMFGSSALLKRSKREFVTDHIDSSVSIGLKDGVDKGLGFEKANMENEEHEYYHLSEEHSKILTNMRETLIEFMIKIAEKLIDDNSNDTALLILVSRILSTSSSIFGMFPQEFEKSWKAHFVNKSTIQNKLILKKYPRTELIRRVMLQYSYRCFHLHTRLNDLDFKVVNILTKFSVNAFYEIVRTEARNQLFELMAQYPYSGLIIVPNIVKFLNKSNNDKKNKDFTKEQLEGVLLLLKGSSMQTTLLVKQNWNILGKLWPALYKCRYFEKETVVKILDKIYFGTNENFNSFDNRIRLSDGTVRAAFELCAETAKKYSNEELRLKVFNQKCFNDNQVIENLFDDLINIATDSSVMWKNQEISLFSIIFLLNSCENKKKLLTVDCIKLFLDSLVNENKNFRRIAIDALCIILKMVKHKKQTKEYDIVDLLKEETNNKIHDESQITINKPNPGYRDDNKWHFFTPNFINTNMNVNTDSFDEAKWSNTNFLDKSYWGYYCWPSKINVNLNKRDNYTNTTSSTNNDYIDAIKPIRDKFQNDAEFVKKFIKLSIIEEYKGNEKFDKKKFYFFKSLFRNFGTSEIFNDLYEHLNRLITDKDTQTQECSHKLAAELISGLIRGSKYWSLPDLKVLWSKLKPLFDLIIENIFIESLDIWVDCFSTVFEDQDPRRMTFYINYFQDLLIDLYYDLVKLKIENKQKPSFKQSNVLQLMISLNQFEWRIPFFWNNQIEPLIEHMSHSNKVIREIIPACALLTVKSDIEFSFSLQYSNSDQILNSKVDNLRHLINFLESRVQKAIDLNELISNDPEARKQIQRENIDTMISSLNLIQSTINWFIAYISRSLQPLNLEIMRLIPLICKMDKIVTYDKGLQIKLSIIRLFLSIWSLDRRCIYLLVDEIKLLIQSPSWQSRIAAIQIIKNFAIFNIFILSNDLKQIINKIIIDTLIDDQLEVRLAACLTLTGFIHSNFIDVDLEFINYLKGFSKIPAKVYDPETGRNVINQQNLTKRHGGILGLCSLVNSSPYDIPSYLPDVITYLCQFTNDPEPIMDSVKKCLSEFRRTHKDNWDEHKLSFNEEQLSILDDTHISSTSYYA